MSTSFYLLYIRKSALFEQTARLGESYYMVYMRPHPTERFRPVDKEHAPAGFEDTLRLLDKSVFVLNLKKHVRGNNRINAVLFEVRPVWSFDITPNRFDVVDPRFFGVVFELVEETLLDFNGIDLAGVPYRMRGNDRERAGACAKIGDTAAALKLELGDGVRRV